MIPESKKQKEDIFIRKKDFSGAKKGDKVVVQITRYPDQHNSAEGRISEIISRAGQPLSLIHILLPHAYRFSERKA